jgi:hypothetical protein
MSNDLNQEQAQKLTEILRLYNVLSPQETEAFVYALVEISESVSKVYSQIIPAILLAKGPDALKDKIWDLREEFRHIQYHIDDAKLKEL